VAICAIRPSSHSAQAHDIEWRGLRLQSLDGSIEFDPHGSGRADSTLKLQGLQIADRKLDHLTLHLRRHHRQSQLTLDARAEGYTLSARGNGHYAAGSWQGEISSAQFGDACASAHGARIARAAAAGR
jgi:hypothetical protein